MERLTGVIQPYAWGSQTAIPEFLGVEPVGEPQAELWLGAHPLAPSTVGRTAGQARRSGPGERSWPSLRRGVWPSAAFSAQDRRGAAAVPAGSSVTRAGRGWLRPGAGGRRSQDAPHRTYRDGWPKPELLCAFIETEALCGFQEPAETYQMFERLAVGTALELVALFSLADADVPAEERLRIVFSRLLRLAPEERSMISEIALAAKAVQEPDDAASFARTARELNAYYPGDPGVLAALLMNRITLQPGDALYMPSGNLHAYLSGGGVEIMANSDNVMRGGLTPKYVNVDELLAILDFTPGLRGLIAPVEESPGGVALSNAGSGIRALAP